VHIAVVCRALGLPGSVAAVALRQSRELARHGEVTLISDSLPAGTRGVLAPVRDLHFLRRFRHVPDEFLFTRAARRALTALHRAHPIDFVLCHSHAVAYLSARSFKHGFFVHGDISDRPRGTYDARLTAFYRWVTPRAYRSADVVFVLSRPFVEIAQRAGAKHVELIPNGIDPEDIGAPASAPADAGASRAPARVAALRVLYVGRLAVEKGLTYLLEAMTGVEKNVTLDIVGSGPLANEIRESDRIRMLGVFPRQQLGEIYRAHDVFCTPALSEPFASVITEALVSGLPVIGTTVGGIPDVVKHGKNGLLVPPADPDALADAITTLARDESLRRTLAANARASVLPRLSWESIGDRIAAVICRMLR